MELLEQVEKKNIESVAKALSDIADAAASIKNKFTKE